MTLLITLPILNQRDQFINTRKAAGTAWYVDNSAGSSGNGTSWATAWKNFSNIAWGSLSPGDTIYISGGTSGQTYTGGMYVQASGSVGNPIIITRGIDPGHNGRVTIYNDASNGQAGFFIEDHNYITIRGFYITTPTYLTLQTDGIYMQWVTGITVEDNNIVISNGDVNGHNDCVQGAWVVTDLTIRNNYCEQNNTKIANASAFWLLGQNGTLRIYNNIIYTPNAKDMAIGVSADNGTGTATNNVNALIYNNTIVGSAWGSIELSNHVSGSSSLTGQVKNNILISTIANAALIRANMNLPTASIDYNLYYAPNSSQPFWQENTDTYYTFGAWQSRGYDAHSLVGDPQFMDVSMRNFSLRATAPAIDKGATISRVTTDFNGVSRPQGGAYDIGAYEYIQAISITTITPTN